MTVFVLLTMCNHTLTEWRPFIVSSSSLPWKWHCMHTTCWCKSIDFILRLLFSSHNILIQKHFLLFKSCRSVSKWKEAVWIEKEMLCKKIRARMIAATLYRTWFLYCKKKSAFFPWNNTNVRNRVNKSSVYMSFFHRPNSTSYHSDKTSIKNSIRFTTLSNFIYVIYMLFVSHEKCLWWLQLQLSITQKF